MPAFTGFLNLYKPGGGSTGLITPDEVVDIDRINANMDLIDANAALWGSPSKRNMQFTDLAANRAGTTGMKLGDTYQETDGGKRLWKYDGTNWVTGEQGLYLIAPTSVVGGTIDADGYTIRGDGVAGNINVNGVFSSRFRRYRVEYYRRYVSGVGQDLIRLRNAGVDKSTTDYQHQSIEGSGAGSTAPISFGAVTQSSFGLAAGAKPNASGTIDFTNPGHAGTDMLKVFAFHGLSIDFGTTINLTLREGFLPGNDANTFDGFSLLGTSAFSTATWMKVYGLA